MGASTPDYAAYGTLRAELEVTLAAVPVLREPRHAALVALCRHLADVMGSDEVSESRTAPAYLSALKDLGRAMAAGSARAPALDGESASDVVGAMRARRAHRSA